MNFGAFGDNLPIITVLFGLMLLWMLLRRRVKPEKTHREVVQNLLAETRMNQALAEAFHHQQRPKKFLATSWQRNKTKLDFLDHSLQVVLNDAFMMAEDFNQQIASAKKYKSTSYTTNLNAGKLKELLTKSREGLEEWLSKNVGQREPPIKYPSIIDGLFGGGR